MEAIIRLALLLMVVVVVSANFEYTTDVDKTLPEYRTLLKNGQELFKGEAMNSEAKVLFTRVRIKNTKGVYFSVKHKQTHSSPKKSQKEIAKAPVECDGLPGIKVTLKIDKKYDKKRYRLLLKDRRYVFCLSEMQIDMFPSGNGKSHMRMNIVFKDITNKQNVGIVMNPFKPPITKVDEDHARANNVLRISDPIPLEEFSKPYFQPSTNTDKDTNSSPQQSFLGDISWMKDVFKQAIFAESLYSGITKTYNEVYAVGPVIIPERVYSGILQLDHAFRRYAHGEGTTMIGSRYVYENNT